MKRFRLAAYSTLIAYALLVATHRGEFFPFSLFPMFSKAGRPWERAVVRDITTAADAVCVAEAERLPGHAVALASIGLDQNDVSKALLKIRVLSDGHDAETMLARLLAPARREHPLAIYQALGALDAAGSVRVSYRLFGLIDGERAQLARTCPP